DVNSDYRPGMPEVHVVPDRAKAADLGIPMQRLAWTRNVAFGGVRNGRFTDGDKRYDVRVRTFEQQRASPDMLKDLFVKTGGGGTGVRGGLHDPGGADQLVRAPAHGAGGGADRRDGGAGHAVGRRRHAQPGEQDRPGAAGGAGEEELDHPGGLHQPAPAPGAG